MSAEDLTISSLKTSFFLPSLEDLSILAAVKASMLHDDVKKIFIQHFLARHRFSHSRLTCTKAYKITTICKSQFKIPELFERKLLSAVRWVRDQYCRWISSVEYYEFKKKFSSKKDYIPQVMDSVIWDLNGTVNYELSKYQFLLSIENYEDEENVIYKFQIASKCCLEDDLRILWEKLPSNKKDDILSEEKYYYFSTYYWASVIDGNINDKEKFLNRICKYMEHRYDKKLEEAFEKCKANHYASEVNSAAFLISVFKENLTCVRYFFDKLPCIDLENLVDIFLTHYTVPEHYYSNWDYYLERVKILFFLLRQLNDDVVERIVNRHFGKMLMISVRFWPCHKFLVQLFKMHLNAIDQVLLFDIMCDLTGNVYSGTADIFLMKNLWKIIPKELKKSFCLYISVSQKKKNIGDLWRYMTIEILNLFLRDDECKTILTPHNNFGFTYLIGEKEFNILNHWLKKCLVTDEAIILFMENFIVSELSNRMKYYPLSSMTQLLDWCCNYEDVMDKEKILQAKDNAVKAIGVKGFVNGIKMQKWKDLEKFTDWILKNRENYDNKLIILKIQALKKILFGQKGAVCWKKKNFAENLIKFLNYKVINTEKLKLMIKKIELYEGENCFQWLTGEKSWYHKPSWEAIDAFLEFLNEYGRDILKVKENMFERILSHDKIENFKDAEYSEKIKKLIDWNSDDDSLSDANKKISQIKNLIIEKYAVKILRKCVYNNWNDAIINFMNCLFKDGDYAKIVLDLKKIVIDKLIKDDSFWADENYLLSLVILVNYGKDNEYLVKEIWNGKKYFIEKFKENVKVEKIPELILEKENNFLINLFENEENENDFEKILWDLKEFLLKKLNNDEDYLLFSQVFERFDEFNEFLNWGNINEININNLKKIILDGNGAQCCLKWIIMNETEKLKKYLEFYILNESDMLKLKENVFENFLCKYSSPWDESYFPLLDKFLNDKNLKKNLIEKYKFEGCIKKLSEGDYFSVENFLNWALKENSIEKFKKDLLKEILQNESIEYWKNLNINTDDDKYDFHVALDKLLYEYKNPNSAKIANMKFDLIENYFDKIFAKLLNGRKIESMKNFLNWTFDENIKSSDEVKINKLKKEILDKFCKQYFVIMLEKFDWEAASKFWDFCAPSKTEIKTKDVKNLLWDLKKECVEQVFLNNIKNDFNSSIYINSFWPNLNKFLLWRHGSSKMKDEICEFKDLIRKKYGIDIIKQYLMDEEEVDSICNPKYFLIFFFGGKNNNKNDSDDRKLLEFKKEILENVFDITFEDTLKMDFVYGTLEKILKFNSLNDAEILNIKKSVVKVQGVQLCIDLICKNSLDTLKEFLNWGKNVLHNEFLNFKKDVVMKLAENLTLAYNWESLKFFLEFGLDLNNEQDLLRYTVVKNYVSESCSVDICYNFILKNSWDEVSMFLQWCFVPENERLVEFKNCLLEKHGPKYCIARIFDNDWEKLEKFLNWCYESHRQNNELEEKIINLKIKTLQKDVSYKDHLEIVLRYLEWGFKSEARLNKFKKSILVKTHPLNYLVTLKKYKSDKTFQRRFSSKN